MYPGSSSKASCTGTGWYRLLFAISIVKAVAAEDERSGCWKAWRKVGGKKVLFDVGKVVRCVSGSEERRMQHVALCRTDASVMRQSPAAAHVMQLRPQGRHPRISPRRRLRSSSSRAHCHSFHLSLNAPPVLPTMYRTGDPRFRRRLHDIGQTLESANETAQSNLYIFGQNYIKPCLASVTECLRTTVDASCPTLNLSATQRDRLRRQQRGTRRGRAELNFDFYDDWDDAFEGDDGWGAGNEEFERLLQGSQGYGTLSSVQQQPGRQRGMSYPKARRKSTVDGGQDPTVIPGSSGFLTRLFGGKGKGLKYHPSAADLQEHPGARRLGRDITEGEALLQEGAEGRGQRHRRMRSGTATSGHTTDSLSSRGDIFPSDEELDDAIPLDDEFAMVLERRTTLSGGGLETETSSGKTRDSHERRRRGKRPSAGSRASTAPSSRSRGGSTKRRSRTNSSAAQTPIDENSPIDIDGTSPTLEDPPTINELKQEEVRIAQEEEADVEQRRQEAQKLAAERGLVEEHASSKEVTPEVQSPVLQPVQRSDKPSQLPTPVETDDEEEGGAPSSEQQAGDDAGGRR